MSSSWKEQRIKEIKDLAGEWASASTTLGEGIRTGLYRAANLLERSPDESDEDLDYWLRLASVRKKELEELQCKYEKLNQENQKLAEENRHLKKSHGDVVTERDRYLIALADLRDDADEALEEPPKPSEKLKEAMAKYHEKQQQTPGPWIKWPGGGEMPVDPLTRVEFQSKSGNRWATNVGALYWKHRNMPGDIVSFRLLENKSQWISWPGGAECPVPDGTKIEYKILHGGSKPTQYPKILRWNKINESDDITHFRILDDEG